MRPQTQHGLEYVRLLYALTRVDGWEFNGELQDRRSTLKNPLDQWVVSRLTSLSKKLKEYGRLRCRQCHENRSCHS